MNNNKQQEVARDIIVKVRDLDVKFGDFFAVRKLSISVSRGEIFGFLGANGAGKTTTIRVLCGLLSPSAGQVYIAGASYRQGEIAIKNKVGYMSQKFTLYNDLSVQENLEFAASLRKIEHSLYVKRRQHLLEFIKFAHPTNTLVKNLPGGIKQQVSLVASLLHDPDIVFLDEPTAGVSPPARAIFWGLIRELQSRGKTIFVTTHYMDEAEYCDRIALMRSGELIALDTVSALKTNTFKQPIYEFAPINNIIIPRDELNELKHTEGIKSFQPYGMRYHASFISEEAFIKSKPLWEHYFLVKETQPSLEDVFIEIIEGGHP